MILDRQIALASLLFWAQKGSLAVLDQGLVVGANFILNILLARWLSPSEYGAFAIAHAVFLLFSIFHTAFLTEPMMIFGPGKYAKHFQTYIGILLYSHWVVASVIALILSLVAFGLLQWGYGEMAQTTVAMAVASPFILLFWLVRRVYYIHNQPSQAVNTSALYLALLLASLYGLRLQGGFSAMSGFWAMGVAGGGASLGFLISQRSTRNSRTKDPAVMMVIKDHWIYSRWAVGSGLVQATDGAGYILLIGPLLSLNGMAAFKAVQTLIQPAYQFFIALGALFIPQCAKHFEAKGILGLTKDALNISIFSCLFALLYWIIVVANAATVMGILYENKYNEYTMLVPYLALAPIFAAAGGGPQTVLRAARKPKLIFVSCLYGACFTVFLGLIFTISMNLYGASIAKGLSPLLRTYIMWRSWLKERRKEVR